MRKTQWAGEKGHEKYHLASNASKWGSESDYFESRFWASNEGECMEEAFSVFLLAFSVFLLADMVYKNHKNGGGLVV